MAEIKNKTKRTNTLSLVVISICSALLCISAYITIPLPLLPVPITLQLFMVVLISLLFKPTHAFTAQLIYTFLGLVGLPVFSCGKGGIGAILSPTGGFIIGFLIISLLISLLKGKKENLARYILISIFIGIPIMYIFGISFFMIYTNADFISAVSQIISIFIIIDIIKCILASITAITLGKTLKKSNIILK